MMNQTITRNRQRPQKNLGVKTARHPLNFDKFAAEGNRFIKDVAEELGVSRNSAARITKAVLHALRDRMPADDAIQFAQGLPMALKAVFIDQYDVSRMPVVIRHAHDFLDYIFYKNEFSAAVDFPEEDSVENALRGVFNVLGCYMDRDQLEHIKPIFGREIVELIEGREYHSQLRGVL
jgi:uncharacterized protein (DUF2267 family)